jgi:hypothetical protein
MNGNLATPSVSAGIVIVNVVLVLLVPLLYYLLQCPHSLSVGIGILALGQQLSIYLCSAHFFLPSISPWALFPGKQ